MSKSMKVIPELRFPEFKSDGNWEERFVDEFFSVGSSKRVLQEDWTSSGVPFYRTRELVSLSKNEPFGSEIFISEELFLELSEKYGIPSEGDFLVSGVGTLGICYQVKAGDRFYFKDGNVLWFKRESMLS
jgi:type I restriction enzyme, S subunit